MPTINLQRRPIHRNNFTSQQWMTQQNVRDNVSNSVLVQDDTPYIRLAQSPNNPFDPSLSTGALYFELPTTANPNLRRIRVRKGGYGGKLLREIKALGYQTYVEQNSQDTTTALVLQIKKKATDDDENVINIVFDPSKQAAHHPAIQSVQKHIWQQWDALQGWWETNEPNDIPEFPAGFTIKMLVEQQGYEDCIIADTRKEGNTSHGGFGIRITVGTREGNRDYQGYVDAFVIGFKNPAVKAEQFDFKIIGH